MTWIKPRQIVAVASSMAIAACVALVQAGDPPKTQERERKVKESEVPKAALDALKKLAGGSALTEFSEEIEHGVTYYEGSWKGAHGNVDALVTVDGDVVEIEEVVPAQTTPKPILEKARVAAGKDTALLIEKKTVVLYEVKYRKDGRRHEVVYSPDGREHEHEEEAGDSDQDD